MLYSAWERGTLRVPILVPDFLRHPIRCLGTWRVRLPRRGRPDSRSPCGRPRPTSCPLPARPTLSAVDSAPQQWGATAVEAIFQPLSIRQQDGHGDRSMSLEELRLALGVSEALMNEALWLLTFPGDKSGIRSRDAWR